MPDPRAHYLVINRRQSGAWPDAVEQPLYGDLDVEPLPAERGPERSNVASRLTDRFGSVIHARGRAQGAVR